MKVPDYVEQLSQHGPGLAVAAQAAGLDAPVPRCGEWTVGDLVRHVGQVHRWATMFVREGRTDPPQGDHELATPPGDGELMDWFVEGHQQLVSTLEAAKPDLECWTFLPAPTPLAFWARRQAHETAIHRLDAEAAGGGGVDFATRFAVDGLDELLLGFFARPRGRLVADPPMTLGIRAADGDVGAEWTVKVEPSSREITRGVARGDCVIEGAASDLYLFLWNRRDVEGISVSGNAKVLDLWQAKATVNWR